MSLNQRSAMVLAVIIVLSQPAFAQYQFVRSIGSSGSGNGQISAPFGVAVDNWGNVFVGDYWNSRVDKFSNNGNFLGNFGHLNMPMQLAVDNSGNVIVCDWGNNRVEKYDNNGVYLTDIGYGTYATPSGGVAVDPWGNIFVSERWQIDKFDMNGALLMRFGNAGNGNGQFQYITFLATDQSGDLFVIDSNNYRIQKFDNNGAYLTQFKNGLKGFPEGVAVNQSGNVFVGDSHPYQTGDVVDVFSNNGLFLTSFGSDIVAFPGGIAVDSSGNIYVSDEFNNRIDVFAPVPEPSTFALLALGFTSLLAYIWRQQRRAT